MPDNPSTLIDGALDRVQEIIWWNRELTKLTDRSLFKNGEEFIKNDLIRVKGPFIEYLRPSARGKAKLSELASELDLHPSLVETIKKNLFSKLDNPDEGRLYSHQEKALRSLCSDKTTDLIITAPTSGGKTEAFLLPILQYCLKSSEAGLKAILIYPMKTLATDQFNRLLKYLDVVNGMGNGRITIAIWDGDTPKGASSHASFNDGFQQYNKAHQRGLICPRCNGDLMLTEDESLSCERCTFTAVWAKTTRNEIINSAANIDILVTNPEALEYMMTSRPLHSLLGGQFGNPPLRFIVIDEAHYWRGAAGSTMNLFSRRLRKIYDDRSIRFILSSATIKDETKFLHSLVEATPETSEVVNFVPETSQLSTSAPDYSKISQTNFDEVMQTVLFLGLVDNSEKELLANHPNLSGSLSTAIQLGLVTKDGDRIVLSDFALGITRLIDEAKIKIERETIDTKVSTITQRLLNNQNFLDSWKSFLLSNSPEVVALVARLEKVAAKKHALVYMPEDELMQFVRDNSHSSKKIDAATARGVLSTCLNLGRTANLLSDKYHMFVGSPTELYYCLNCKWLSSDQTCPKCGKIAGPLRFCQLCHTPHVGVAEKTKKEEKEESTEPQTEEETDSDEDIDPSEDVIDDRAPEEAPLEPEPPGKIIYQPLYEGKFCRHKIRPPSVYYPSFITYLLSYLCRESSSRKVLVFSDSRRTANMVVDNFQRNDHSLVAQQLFVRELLRKSDLTLELGAIRNPMLRKLRAFYSDFLWASADSDDFKTYLRDYMGRVVYSKADLHNMRQIWGGTIVAPEILLKNATSNNQLVIGYKLFVFLYSQHERKVKFTINKVKFQGKTPSKMAQSMIKIFKSFDEDVVRKDVLYWIGLFLDNGLLVSPSKDELEEKIRNAPMLNPIGKKQIQDYFASEKLLLEQTLGRTLDDSNSPVLRPFRKTDDLDGVRFTLIPKVAFCEKCMKIWPVIDDEFKCPVCENDMTISNRVSGDTARSCDFKGDWPWKIDHWAHEIVDIAARYKGENEEVSYVFPGVHTAVAQQEIRGILEKGFKHVPPEVNFISATPTLEVGVDIGSLDIIVQVGIPPTLTNYVQRCGRAGRILGRPSFVWTVLRNTNSVDNYHFDHLDDFLKELKPLYVPEPEELDMVVASQMVGELLSYASKKTDEVLFDAIMKIPDDAFATTEAISKRAIQIASAICELATDKERLGRLIPDRFKSIFGKTQIFSDLFANEASLINLESATKSLFKNLGELSAESISEYRDTRKWLNELGYFSSYRGGIHAIPIVQKKKKRQGGEAISMLFLQDFGHVTSENYPGPRNNYGAKFSYEGVSYLVKRVLATQRLADIRLCTNVKCSFKWWAYPENVQTCLWCKKELASRTIMRPDQIQVESTDRYGECYPEISAYPRIVEENEKAESRVFSIPTTIRYGRVACVIFTPVYRWSGTEGNLESEVPVPKATSKYEKGGAIDSLVASAIQGDFGHIGYVHETQGLVFEFPTNKFNEKYQGHEKAGIVSLQQASRLAASISSESELDDLEARWSIDQDSMKLFVFDTKTRGSGIARRVFRGIVSDDDSFRSALKEISSCPHCVKYCSRCLLLERTPPNYITEDLLDKNLVKRLLK